MRTAPKLQAAVAGTKFVPVTVTAVPPPDTDVRQTRTDIRKETYWASQMWATLN